MIPRRRRVLWWAILAGVAVPRPVWAAEPVPPPGPYVDLYRKIAPAVVSVGSLGTGVVISPDGLVLTAASVVPPGERVPLHFAEGKRRTAKVVGRDAARDAALLRIDPPESGLPAVAWAAEEPPLGRTVCTLGNAFLSIFRDGQVAMGVGIVSGGYVLSAPRGRGRASYGGRVIEITAAVNPGMGGAPVVNREGRLVGIVTMNFDKTRWLGAAIPLGVIKPAVEDLKAGRVPAAAAPSPPPAEGYFGVEVEDAPEGGVTVVKVEKDSPAARVDVRVGDRIVEFNGQPVESREGFQEGLAETKPEARVRLTLERGSDTMEKMVELGKPPEKGGGK